MPIFHSVHHEKFPGKYNKNFKDNVSYLQKG